MARSTKSNAWLIPVVLLIGLAIETAIFWEKLSVAQNERESMREIAKQREEKLKELETQLEFYKRYADRIIGDREFIESEIRSTLGRAEKDEIVIREEETPRRNTR